MRSLNGGFADSIPVFVSSNKGGISIDQNEFMGGIESQHLTQKISGINVDSTAVLVIVPEHYAYLH